MPTIFDPPGGKEDLRPSEHVSRLQAWVRSNIGAVIAEKYEIVRCLGTGGMGGVFLAQHRLLAGSYFALKLIIPRPQSGPADEQERRFTREARTAMRFVHPRAAQVRDFGFDRSRGLMYMAMDYLEGRRLDLILADAIDRNTQGVPVIETARALRVTYLILEVLKAAHAADVIHRDLKPGNILLVSSGPAEDVRVLDFGCARVVSAASAPEPVSLTDDRHGAGHTQLLTDRITGPGIVMGTVQYMAPEQARGEKLDNRADLYSVGVVLYEMLTGKIPHEAKRNSLLILARALKPAVPVEKARPDIALPKVVKAILERALALKREDRFADAGEFACAIDEALRITGPAGNALPGEAAAAAMPGVEAQPDRRTPSTVAFPPRRRPGATTAASMAFGAARKLAAAAMAGVAILVVAWLGWTRVGYSLYVARGEAALAREDFPRALEAFDRARELRPADPRARELAASALADRAVRRAMEEASRGDLDGLRLHAAKARELGAGAARVREIERLVTAATRATEARRLAEARQFSRARKLLELLPEGLPEPWATRASVQRSAVDAELSVADRLLTDGVRHAARESPEGNAIAAAALGEFLGRFPDHPRRADAVLLRARVLSRLAAGDAGDAGDQNPR